MASHWISAGGGMFGRQEVYSLSAGLSLLWALPSYCLSMEAEYTGR
jgi:hypothetical protein